MKIKWKQSIAFILLTVGMWLETHNTGAMLMFTAAVLYFSSLCAERDN